MNNKSAIILPLLAGLALGSGASIAAYTYIYQSSKDAQLQSADTVIKKPLYWVSPMNPDYKRDKPGKSPMGMDLIPFYEETNTGKDTGLGTIRISSDVVNNLGVRTALVINQPLHTKINTVGYVQYDEDRLIMIHPRVEGWIEKLYVKAEGDPVKKGEPLYEIYSPALVNAQKELIIALDRGNTRLIQAAEDRLKALKLPRQTIKALKKSRKINQTITLYAPQSGVVTSHNIREGIFVKPSNSIMSIGSLDQVWVEAEIFERQVFQVREGLPVTMSLEYLPGKNWSGKVDYIYPTLNAETRTVKVRLRFDNEDKYLKPNMFSQITIHAQAKESTLLVPKEAVIRSGSFDRLVLALGEGRFKSIKVNVGRIDDQSAEILSGVKAGERVVASAQFLLDSESSKTSDFKRMNMQSDEEREVSTLSATVLVDATITSLMKDHRMMTFSHQAIKEWGWPEKKMTFTIPDSIDISILKPGMNLSIEIHKSPSGKFKISKIHAPNKTKMNHETMATGQLSE
ncbi:efflux RND transporter periplasmic adaptor subunit [Kiloniella antarctica]|uniref:Efflux RND transporter periplasmic adaptor subunit n=1 Tax=Kiloniella antarctica TaxID=1550907 RepID=A0ABW5BNC8_9PROT